MNRDKIKVILKEENKKAEVKELSLDVHFLQGYVGGLIDMTSMPNMDGEVDIICNDNFLNNGSKPNEWAKEIKKNDSNTATEIQRVEYWTEFKNYASNNKQFSSVFKFRKPSTNHWYDFAIGSSDCHLSILQVRKNNEINVEVYIDEDKDLFHQLHNNKDEIERNTNLKFDWMELPTKKASRILVKRNTDFSDKNNWAADFEWIMDVMLKVKKEFKKYL